MLTKCLFCCKLQLLLGLDWSVAMLGFPKFQNLFWPFMVLKLLFWGGKLLQFLRVWLLESQTGQTRSCDTVSDTLSKNQILSKNDRVCSSVTLFFFQRKFQICSTATSNLTALCLAQPFQLRQDSPTNKSGWHPEQYCFLLKRLFR